MTRREDLACERTPEEVIAESLHTADTAHAGLFGPLAEQPECACTQLAHGIVLDLAGAGLEIADAYRRRSLLERFRLIRDDIRFDVGGTR